MVDQPHATDSLFFAAFPDAACARNVEMLGEELRCRYGLKGKMLAAERLHVSLQHVGLPEAVVDKASRIAATVRRPTFTVSFNSVMSFRGRPGNQPSCCAVMTA